MKNMFKYYLNSSKLLRVAVVLLSVSLSGVLHAFKIDTHVAIGLEIIDDIDRKSGKVNIHGLGEYLIDSKAKRSILNHQDAFLAGTIGPDFYPDLIVGQSIVHPGNEHGWKTKDFIKKLLKKASTDEEYAFALGYMVHAASDVFAHSYVNFYSGEEFNLMDGELDVELRHIVLEGYISKKLLSAKQKSRVKRIFNASNIPADFIKSIFYDEKDVRQQYKSAAGNHIKLIKSHQKNIQGIRKELGKYRGPLSKYKSDILDEIDRVNKYGWEIVDYTHVKPVCVTTKTFEEVCDTVCSKVGKVLLGAVCLAKKEVCKDVPRMVCKAAKDTKAIVEEINVLGTRLAAADVLFGHYEAIYQYLGEIDSSIDAASVELVKASHKAAKQAIQGKNSGILDAYKDWAICYGPILGGVPKAIAKNTSCAAYQLYQKLNEAVEGFEDVAGAAMYGVVGNRLKVLVEREINEALFNETSKIVDSVMGVGLDDLFDLFEHPVNQHSLNRVFNGNVSSKNLLNIDGMDKRVAFEVGGAYKNKLYNFDPSFNAIQLSKIALMGDSQRGFMALSQGFDFNGNMKNPVLEVDNIDADHQWLRTPPPLPKASRNSLKFRKKNIFPGMSFYARSPYLFKKLFRGPLNKGALVSINGEKALPSWYPYKTCTVNPFPYGVSDRNCSLLYLIPILSTMNNHK